MADRIKPVYCPLCAGSVVNVGNEDEPLMRCKCCDTHFTVNIQDKKWISTLIKAKIIEGDVLELEQLELDIKGA